MREKELLNQIQVLASKLGARLFRVNTAMAWAGGLVKPHRLMNVTVGPGDVVLRNARPIRAGLCQGGSDLIGWTVVKITTDMVGREVAIFTAAEGKTPGEKLTPEQRDFLLAVEKSGGIAVEAREPKDIERGVCEFRIARF